jgi:hypothetical protein
MMDAVHDTRFPVAAPVASPRNTLAIIAAAWRWARQVRLAYARSGTSGLTPDLTDGPAI